MCVYVDQDVLLCGCLITWPGRGLLYECLFLEVATSGLRVVLGHGRSCISSMFVLNLYLFWGFCCFFVCFFLRVCLCVVDITALRIMLIKKLCGLQSSDLLLIVFTKF